MADLQTLNTIYDYTIDALSSDTGAEEIYLGLEQLYNDIPIEYLDHQAQEAFADNSQTIRNVFGDDIKPLNIMQMVPPMPAFSPDHTEEDKLDLMEQWEEQAKTTVKLKGGFSYLFNKDEIDRQIEGLSEQRQREVKAIEKFGTDELGNLAEGSDYWARFMKGLGADTLESFGADDAAQSVSDFFVENPRNDEKLSSMVVRGLGMGIGQIGVGLAAAALTGGAGAAANVARVAKGGSMLSRAATGFRAAGSSTFATRFARLAAAGSGASLDMQGVYDRVYEETGDADLAFRQSMMEAPAALVDFIVDYAVVGKVLNPALKWAGKSKATKVKALAEAMKKTNDPAVLRSIRKGFEESSAQLRDYAIPTLKSALTSGSAEAISEAIQGVSGDYLVRQATGEGGDPLDLDARATDAFVGFAVGAILGGFGGSLSAGQEVVPKRAQEVYMQRVDQQLARLDLAQSIAEQEYEAKQTNLVENLSSKSLQKLKEETGQEPTEAQQQAAAIIDRVIEVTNERITATDPAQIAEIETELNRLEDEYELLNLSSQYDTLNEQLQTLEQQNDPATQSLRENLSKEIREVRRKELEIAEKFREHYSEKLAKDEARTVVTVEEETAQQLKNEGDPSTIKQLNSLQKVKNIDTPLGELTIPQLNKLSKDIQKSVSTDPDLTSESKEGLSTFAANKLSAIRQEKRQAIIDDLGGNTLTKKAFNSLDEDTRELIPEDITPAVARADLDVIQELGKALGIDEEVNNSFTEDGEINESVVNSLVKNNPDLASDVSLIFGGKTGTAATDVEILSQLTLDDIELYRDGLVEVVGLFSDETNIQKKRSQLKQRRAVTPQTVFETGEIAETETGTEIEAEINTEVETTPEEDAEPRKPRQKQTKETVIEIDDEIAGATRIRPEETTTEEAPKKKVTKKKTTKKSKTKASKGTLYSATEPITEPADFMEDAEEETVAMGETTSSDPFSATINSQPVTARRLIDEYLELQEQYPEIVAEPVSSDDPPEIRDILKAVQEFMGKPNILRFRKLAEGVMGQYYRPGQRITVGVISDLSTLAHEFAHYLDDIVGLGIASDWIKTKGKHEFDAELEQFWIYGTPWAARQGKRVEGVAEYLKARILNPAEAMQAAPKFEEYFKSKMPPEMLTQLDEISRMYREFHGSPGLHMISGQIQGTKDIMDVQGQWASKLFGHTVTPGFAITWFDKLSESFLKSTTERGVLTKLMDFTLDIRKNEFTNDPETARLTGKRLIAGTTDFRVFYDGLRKVSAVTQFAYENGIPTYDPKMWAEYQKDPEAWRKKNKGKKLPTLSNSMSNLYAPYSDMTIDEMVVELDFANAWGVAARILTTEDLGPELANLLEKRDGVELSTQEAKRLKQLKLKRQVEGLTEKETKRLEDLQNKQAGIALTSDELKRLDWLRGRLSNIIGATGNLKGLSDFEAAKDLIDTAAKKAKLDPEYAKMLDRAIEYNKAYTNYADGLLKFLVETGVLSKDDFKRIKKYGEHYISFSRLVETGIDEILETRQSDMIRRRGKSGRRIRNPIQSLTNMTDAVIRKGLENKAAATFVSLFDTYSDKPKSGELLGLENIARKLDSKPNNMETAQVIEARIDGKVEYWEIQDEYLYKTMQNTMRISGKLPVAGWFMNMFQDLITSFPGFLMRNIVRDTGERVIFSDAPIDDSVKKIFEARGEMSPQMLKMFMGDQSGWYMRDEVDTARAQRALMKDAGVRSNSLFVGADALHTAKDWYNGVKETSESYNRMKEFEVQVDYLVKQGYSPIDAYMLAGNRASQLMDFTSSGYLASILGSGIPFFGAGTVGFAKTIRTYKNDPGRAIPAAMIMVGLPMLFERLMAAMGDYEDEYDTQPAYIKDLFFNFKLGDNIWMRVPKPFSAVGISASISRGIDRLEGKQGSGDGLLNTVAHTFLPPLPSDASGPLFGFVQVAANYDQFRGKPIVPIHEEGLRLSKRNPLYYSNSSPPAKALADLLIWLGLDDSHIATTYADPRKIDALIGNILGTSGSFISKSLPNAFRSTQDAQKAFFQAAGVLNTFGGPYTRDMTWLTRLAQTEDLNTRHRDFTKLKNLSVEYWEAKTNAEKQRVSNKIIKAAAKLRKQIETKGFDKYEKKKNRRKKRRR